MNKKFVYQFGNNKKVKTLLLNFVPEYNRLILTRTKQLSKFHVIYVRLSVQSSVTALFPAMDRGKLSTCGDWNGCERPGNRGFDYPRLAVLFKCSI
jgi:hypothetical protein